MKVKPLTPEMGLYPSEIKTIAFLPGQELKVHEIVTEAMARARKPHVKQIAMLKLAIAQGARELTAMKKLLALHN
jgi:hypothetical protein